MALQYLDKRIIGAIIVDAWQNHFQTEMDPADGQWFTNGPNNNGGLYGALTDTLGTDLVFDKSEQVFTRSQSVPIQNIPKGRVYQVVLLSNKNDLRVPYRADVFLSGTSTACFASAIKGQRFWSVDAGTLCDWINHSGAAGADSWKYSRDPQSPTRGRVSVFGTLTATQTINFTARTSDVTDTFQGSEPLVARSTSGELVTPGSVIVEVPLAA